MATHTVAILNKVAAENIGSYNRSAIAGSAVDLDNGNVFRLDSQSATSGESEVWSVSAPTTSASTLNGLWMAYSPEIVITVSGTKQYRGIDPDPQDFYNVGAKVFDAYKPQVGDVITVTGEAFTGTPALAYANAANGVYTLAWGASQTANALSFRYLGTTYISKASGAIENQRVTAYKLECIAN
jgi:hypothetical protein